MIKIERKIIKGKPFFYLSEQINIGVSFKKIQVYLGKNIPKDFNDAINKLMKKEIDIVNKNIKHMFILDNIIFLEEHIKIETLRIKMKYIFWAMSDAKKEKFWREFAIVFIFESNAIEGSKLSEQEVKSIINKSYIKKSIPRKEIQEVRNSIKAFDFIRLGDFKFNQQAIIKLHKIVVHDLDIDFGYKKVNIVVNNKKTVLPENVRREMTSLLLWVKEQKRKKTHPFALSLHFHNRFESIHPFSDGNGRVGRILFIWMMLEYGYGVILFENKNRQAYFSSLSQADEGRPRKLYRHCVRAYQRTFDKFFN